MAPVRIPRRILGVAGRCAGFEQPVWRERYGGSASFDRRSSSAEAGLASRRRRAATAWTLRRPRLEKHTGENAPGRPVGSCDQGPSGPARRCISESSGALGSKER